MATLANDNVDYRLLNKLSKVVICSRCLRSGKVTPVPQVISKRHTRCNVCPHCRLRQAGSKYGTLGKVLRFRRK